MKIRRFTAPDMEAALRLVHQTLGPEAVILETRGGGARTTGGVTVVAAIDRHTARGAGAGADAPEPDPQRREGPGADPLASWRDSRAARASQPMALPAIAVAVTSGKGGVGKTCVAANLAIALAQLGRRVLLLDGDLGLANVDLLLGLTPTHDLHDVVSGRKRIEEVVLHGPAGIQVLPAASGVSEMAELDDIRRELLLNSVAALAASRDALIIDTGSGIHRQTLRFTQLAREILVLTTPEAPAYSDAYATIKTLTQRNRPHRPRVVLNRVRDLEDAAVVIEKLRRVTRQFLGFEPEVYGVVPEDDAVGHASRAQQPFVTAYPHAPASQAVNALARRLLAGGVTPRAAASPAADVNRAPASRPAAALDRSTAA